MSFSYSLCAHQLADDLVGETLDVCAERGAGLLGLGMELGPGLLQDAGGLALGRRQQVLLLVQACLAQGLELLFRLARRVGELAPEIVQRSISISRASSSEPLMA
jgi:hypothetical protein